MPIARSGMQKPRGRVQIDPSHPFARDLRLIIPFAEQYGPSVTTSVVRTPIETGGTVQPGYFEGDGLTGPVWTGNADGTALRLVTVSERLRYERADAGTNDVEPIPTDAVTILLIRRKTDTTLRAAVSFGGSATDVAYCHAFLPYSDGNVIFDFGYNGFALPNRLTIGSLSFTTAVERWVLTAGPFGSTVWRNGIKVGSQATAVTRTAATGSSFYLNGGAGNNGDLQEFNFFQIVGKQWVDDLCQWWSAEPYAHLYTEPRRAYVWLGAAATVTRPSKKGGKKGGGLGGPATYGPTLVVPWDSVNSFGAS